MTREAINELKKYTLGKKNTEKVEISVLQLNRIIKALEQESEDTVSRKLVKAQYKRRLEANLKDESIGLDLTYLADCTCTRFNEFIDSIPPVSHSYDDAISRETVKTEYKRRLESSLKDKSRGIDLTRLADCTWFNEFIDSIPPVNPQPKTGHYEKHIDHTDCIWYGSDSGCPVTCSQYRDGWNDAMDYIFKNGKGYQPYRHDG